MGLFDSIISTVGGYKGIDDLLEETIFDGYQEFQNSCDWVDLFKYPDGVIIKRCYEIEKRRIGNSVRYTDDMTQEETRQLKYLLNTVLNTPSIVRTLRARAKTFGYNPMELCGGIQGTWYLVDRKYDLNDPSDEIDPEDIAFVRNLGFPI